MKIKLYLDQAAFALLCVLALTFPFERVVPVWQADELSFTNVELTLFAILVLWLLTWFFPSWHLLRNGPPVPRPLVDPLIGWSAVLLVSTFLTTSHQAEALRFCIRMFSGFLLAWATYALVQSGSRWHLLLRAMALSGLLVGVFGVLEFAQIATVEAWLSQFKYAPSKAGEILRVSSTLGYATIASMVLELTLPLTLAWILTTPQRWLQSVLSFFLVAGLTALVLTLTRAGILSLSILLLLMAGVAWIQHPQVAKWRIVMSGSIVTLLALWVLVVSTFIANPLTRLRLVSETEGAWYRATYQAPPELTAQPGELLTIPVAVTNTSVRAWHSAGTQPFALSYHLFKDGEVYSYDGIRSVLPYEVPPDTTVEMDAQLAAPTQPGEYGIAWDMVQEDVTWFSWKRTPQGVTKLIVLDGPVAESPATISTKAFRVPYAPVGRLTLWRAALAMTQERPLFGVGPDNFRWLYGPYANLNYWDTNIHANNLYLEWLADTGIIGLVIFLWFMTKLLMAVWQNLEFDKKQLDSNIWVWRLALFAALLGWFIHGFFDYFYEFTPTYVGFWMLVGLAIRRITTTFENAYRL